MDSKAAYVTESVICTAGNTGLKLTRPQASAVMPRASLELPAQVSSAGSAQARSILIVCDKPLGINLARELVSLKYPARVAGTLNAAFTILRSTPPDVAVISSGIAGGTGAWLVRQIRESHPAIRL